MLAGKARENDKSTPFCPYTGGGVLPGGGGSEEGSGGCLQGIWGGGA